ncbi:MULTISPECIES: hypothetical protein [unclassified Streptomyces]|uniref:hypothetical protein n=1 Tax=unclassified Streptomyces TaxID=2593676 RepID=UPI003D72CF2C
MRGTRLLGVTAATALAAGALAAGPARAEEAPQADLAYHGYALLAGGRLEMRLTAQNHGPAPVADATVRLRWSVPLAKRTQRLPDGCVRTAARDVVCRTGELDADAWGERMAFGVWLRGRPTEVLLEIDTVWSGGSVDVNRGNDRQRVLVLDTGDRYHF